MRPKLYSDWKSANFRNVFKSRSDISQLSGRFLFVGMAVARPLRVLFKPLTVATSLIHTTDQESIWDRSRINRADSIPNNYKH